MTKLMHFWYLFHRRWVTEKTEKGAKIALNNQMIADFAEEEEKDTNIFRLQNKETGESQAFKVNL